MIGFTAYTGGKSPWLLHSNGRNPHLSGDAPAFLRGALSCLGEMT